MWQAEDCTITAEIMSINRGGALVNFEGLRGFLPGSHAPQGLTEDHVGKVVPLKFLEVDQAKNRLVVSNRCVRGVCVLCACCVRVWRRSLRTWSLDSLHLLTYADICCGGSRRAMVETKLTNLEPGQLVSGTQPAST